ncbi:leucine-rich repeat domain-containing protein [Actinoplanes sp. NPDC051470]|uniref:leucine-rich repeat domain-containing protein n=1 Tax=unclassified Actinoplanes TaxID=2626549 RepID=UPI003439CDEA
MTDASRAAPGVAERVASAGRDGTGRVDLNGLGLREVPTEILGHPGIRRLDLSGNRLREVPGEIFRLPGLEGLNLAGNRLTALPPEAGSGAALRHLDLSENRLTALPAELAGTGLVDLRLRDNALADAAPLTGLRRLRLLDLSGNRLRALPRLDTTELTRLDLSGNALETLPSWFGALRGLRVLDLSGNRLADVRPLADLPLRELFLDDNALAKVPVALAGSPTLRRLSMRRNPCGPPRATSPSCAAWRAAARAEETAGAVRALTAGENDPTRQYFDAAMLTLLCALHVTGLGGMLVVARLHYRRYRSCALTMRFADGSQVDLTHVSLRTATELIRRHYRETGGKPADVRFQPSRSRADVAVAAELAVDAVSRSADISLRSTDAAGIVINQHFGDQIMGDNYTIGDVTNSNFAIRSSLERVTQTITAGVADDGARAELNRLLTELASVVQALPPAERADGETVVEAAEDLVTRAAGDRPNRTLVELSCETLQTVAGGLTSVAPIAAAIAQAVNKLVGG